MLKGINRQVVELCDTGNEYFEKAILFVKPEYYGLGEGKLRERARLTLKNAGNPPKTKVSFQNNGKVLMWLKLAAAAAAGAAASAIVCFLLS